LPAGTRGESCSRAKSSRNDRNSYSVAWQLIGEGVEVVISNGRLRINLAGREVAVYAETGGRR
jgi:hypothetical protein